MALTSKEQVGQFAWDRMNTGDSWETSLARCRRPCSRGLLATGRLVSTLHRSHLGAQVLQVDSSVFQVTLYSEPSQTAMPALVASGFLLYLAIVQGYG